MSFSDCMTSLKDRQQQKLSHMPTFSRTSCSCMNKLKSMLSLEQYILTKVQNPLAMPALAPVVQCCIKLLEMSVKSAASVAYRFSQRNQKSNVPRQMASPVVRTSSYKCCPTPALWSPRQAVLPQTPQKQGAANQPPPSVPEPAHKNTHFNTGKPLFLPNSPHIRIQAFLSFKGLAIPKANLPTKNTLQATIQI